MESAPDYGKAKRNLLDDPIAMKMHEWYATREAFVYGHDDDDDEKCCSMESNLAHKGGYAACEQIDEVK